LFYVFFFFFFSFFFSIFFFRGLEVSANECQTKAKPKANASGNVNTD
jgi:hypothetical protein